MSMLHPVFNIVKLTLAPEDPVPSQHPHPPPFLEIVNGEEEWIVEAILDSRVVNRKLWYLVKWEGFRIEHNSWEPWDGVHAPDLIVDFHQTNPGASHQIQFTEFNTIPFCSIPSLSGDSFLTIRLYSKLSIFGLHLPYVVPRYRLPCPAPPRPSSVVVVVPTMSVALI